MHERRDVAILALAVRPCNSLFRGMSAVRGKPAGAVRVTISRSA